MAKLTYEEMEQRLKEYESLLQAFRNAELDGGIGYHNDILLIRLQKQEEELEHYRKHLEELVQMRTQELELMNQDLKEEIDRRIDTEEILRAAYREKEILLQELNHRTKNNMQAISSMLALQADISGDEQVKSILHDTQNRIKSMALVHQKLYQADNLSRIDLRDYINDLGMRLMVSYQMTGRITLSLEIEDIYLTLRTAIPCGQIFSELLSNAMKYAFPGDMKGEIRIRVHRIEQDIIEMHIADNGIGVPKDFNFRSPNTFGLQSVYALTEHQLQGRITFVGDNGVTCIIQFHDSSTKN